MALAATFAEDLLACARKVPRMRTAPMIPILGLLLAFAGVFLMHLDADGRPDLVKRFAAGKGMPKSTAA